MWFLAEGLRQRMDIALVELPAKLRHAMADLARTQAQMAHVKV